MLKELELNLNCSLNGRATKQFCDLGIHTFVDALTFIHLLPYQRNTDPYNYFLVIPERRATCTAKHAIIKTLADEQGIKMQMMMGIFIMTERNMPKLKDALNKYGLQSIGLPEAHCYLKYNENRIDITFPEIIRFPKQYSFINEIEINPNQIGQYKIELHRSFLKEWILKNNIQYSLDEIWNIREEFIEILSFKN